MSEREIILRKSQSIMEYLIVLTAIIFVILANTVGLKRGVQTSLDKNQKILETQAKGNETPENVKSEDYYTSAHPRNDSEWTNNTDKYNNTAYKNEYYFHEGKSDMSYAPDNNTILDRDDTYVPPPPSGEGWDGGSYVAAR